MKRSVLRLLVCVLSLSLLQSAGAATTPSPDHGIIAVSQLLRSIADDLSDPTDRAAINQLITAVSKFGTLTEDKVTAWMVLTFARDGTLVAVKVNADVLLTAPPLLQRAAVLHELEHIKSAKETRRLLNGSSERAFDSPQGMDLGLDQVQTLTQPAHPDGVRPAEERHTGCSGECTKSPSKLQHVVRVLVDDEFRAYSRDIVYVYDVVKAHGGLALYLAMLPPADRLPMQQYYQRHVQPFVTQEGRIDDQRLRRDFIFLQTFPRHFPRYYEAALAWEALQGHVELRLGPDGHWHPTRLIAPAAFLAWLVP